MVPVLTLDERMEMFCNGIAVTTLLDLGIPRLIMPIKSGKI